MKDELENPCVHMPNLREGLWVEKISQCLSTPQALLVIGAGHAKNTFGLVDALQAKDIKMEIIEDLLHLDDLLME
ncbi:hypothetical protein HY641_03145 [Candidatus Woesearchaeota archaeon]|nr:hypothetical protein [Candidatus Woesearchaeota archaeon]